MSLSLPGSCVCEQLQADKHTSINKLNCIVYIYTLTLLPPDFPQLQKLHFLKLLHQQSVTSFVLTGRQIHDLIPFSSMFTQNSVDCIYQAPPLHT